MCLWCYCPVVHSTAPLGSLTPPPAALRRTCPGPSPRPAESRPPRGGCTFPDAAAGCPPHGCDRSASLRPAACCPTCDEAGVTGVSTGASLHPSKGGLTCPWALGSLGRPPGGSAQPQRDLKAAETHINVSYVYNIGWSTLSKDGFHLQQLLRGGLSWSHSPFAPCPSTTGRAYTTTLHRSQTHSR